MTPARPLTPPRLAEQLGVSPEKVIAWIRSGELAAVNVATRADGRKPRYVIMADGLDMFLARRAVQPPAPRAARRRRADPAVTQYF